MLNKLYLTNYGYLSDGTGRTNVFHCFKSSGLYDYDFICSVEEALKEITDTFSASFERDEKVYLPLLFILGEQK